MTFLGGHDAQIALRQSAETRVTVALTETFPGDPPTVDALNLLQVFNTDFFTQPLVKTHLLTTKFESIANRTGRLGEHFVQISLKFHSSPVESENRFTEGC